MTLPPRPFCLIRHGQTDANRDGIIAGRTEAVLTDAGRAAAAALARYDWAGPVAMFCSPQARARDTAALAFPAHRPVILDGLRERDWGVFEGRPVADLPPRNAPAPDWEEWSDMIARVADALRAGMAQDALPVFVAHSGVIRAARVLTGGRDDGPSPPNTTPILFRPHNGGWIEGRA